MAYTARGPIESSGIFQNLLIEIAGARGCVSLGDTVEERCVQWQRVKCNGSGGCYGGRLDKTYMYNGSAEILSAGMLV